MGGTQSSHLVSIVVFIGKLEKEMRGCDDDDEDDDNDGEEEESPEGGRGLFLLPPSSRVQLCPAAVGRVAVRLH